MSRIMRHILWWERILESIR